MDDLNIRVTTNGRIESNLVYPLDKGYYYIAKLDKEWVETKLEIEYKNDNAHISNKYVASLRTNDGGQILVVNHDGIYWMIGKSKV